MNSEQARFISDVRSASVYDSGAYWLGSVEVSLKPNDGSLLFPPESIVIYSIVQHGERGSREASATMKWLCSLADKHRIVLALYVEAIKKHQPGLRNVQLKQWYGRLGFERDSSTENVMIRKPRMTKIEAATRLKAGRETGEGAGALFYCPETENFLIVKRSDEGDAGGTWCGLGGGRDNMEPLHETVRREAWEEAQFDRRAACELRYIGCLKHPDGFKFHNYLGIVPEEFTPVLNEEHTDYQWCRWNEFPKEMHQGMMMVMNSPDGRAILEKHTTAFM